MRVLALRADAEKLDPVSEDAVTVESMSLTPQKVKRRAVNIVYPAAFHATNVMVRVQIAIESSLFAAELQLLYYACPGQQIEIAIHGSKAHLGKSLPDNLIQTHGSGVRGELLEFLQNHLPLSGISLGRMAVHGYQSYY
jgi:hypothetical protein